LTDFAASAKNFERALAKARADVTTVLAGR